MEKGHLRGHLQKERWPLGWQIYRERQQQMCLR
jgi:hypothetical protein